MSETVEFAPSSSAAPAPDAIGAMSSEERHSWRMTGELPARDRTTDSPASVSDATEAPSSTYAESSPAKPVDQAAATAANITAPSEAATSKRSNAETRKAELGAEIQALLKQRDELRQSVTSGARPSQPTIDVPASSPAPESRSLEHVIATPDTSRPALDETAFYTQFPEATVGQYVRYAARYEHFALQRESQAHQAITSRVQHYDSLMEKAVEAHPELMERVPEVLQSVRPIDLLGPNEPAGPLNWAMQEIWQSPQSAAILLHIADHPDVLVKIQRSGSPAETIRTIAQLDARLTTSVPSQPPAPAGTPVSLAPPPPATLGKKPAQPADELSEAIRSGDFARYRELQNRKDLKTA